MRYEDVYQKLAEDVLEHYQQFIQQNGEEASLIDPNDKKVIGFQYGETHLATAMIIYGYEYSKQELVKQGRSILIGFINNIKQYTKEPAYHWDFNNFALCVLYEYLEDNHLDGKLQEVIKNFVLRQLDSKNPTINWLPMRIFVNSCKYRWMNDKKYEVYIEKLKKNINDAQYEDGFFEDLLPKGKSFNFQYHIYTTAILAFLSLRGIRIANIDKAITQVENIIDPLGDVNYLGRGMNQIFAWGPLLYLLKTVESSQLEKAIKHVSNVAPKAVLNNNIILNDLPGEQKGWWWDYHYASVYHSHFAFWLMIALIEKQKVDKNTVTINATDSGVHFFDTKDYFVCTFDGRKHYLAERGKIVANICSKSNGYIFKGAFGPYPGNFGNRYSVPDAVLHNYFGPIQEKISRLGRFTIKPIFPKVILVESNNGKLIIRFTLNKEYDDIRFVLPLYCRFNNVKVLNGNNEVGVIQYGTINGPYGKVDIFQSRKMTTQEIKVVFE